MARNTSTREDYGTLKGRILLGALHQVLGARNANFAQPPKVSAYYTRALAQRGRAPAWLRARRVSVAWLAGPERSVGSELERRQASALADALHSSR